MRFREVAAVTCASAFVTLDGAMGTVALPAIARTFDAPMSVLQWITGAPLLALTALLPAGGALGDRLGHRRMSLIGLMLFGVGAAAAAMAPNPTWLICARFAQGSAGALILPGAVAIIRAACRDGTERVRTFGAWAAGTGLAATLGPLISGALVDVASWRAVFGFTATLALPALLGVATVAETRVAAGQRHASAIDVLSLIALLGSVAFILIEGPVMGWTSPVITATAGVLGASGAVVFSRVRRGGLVPAELRSSRHCVAANAATFLLYFAMFGFSFLMLIYLQVALDYPVIWAAAGVTPLSTMLLLSARFARVTKSRHLGMLLAGGPLVGSAGIMWVAHGPHPLLFWSHIVPGAALFGLGLAMTVSALTEAAVASVPDRWTGAASGIHHMTVRLAGLIAVAVLGSTVVAADGSLVSLDGFRAALMTCGILSAVAAPIAVLLVRDRDLGFQTTGSA